MFPSPHPGIINFFSKMVKVSRKVWWFPSPHPGIINFFEQFRSKQEVDMFVSVPSSGDYQFLQKEKKKKEKWVSFRPLIRGLSISSDWLIRTRMIPDEFPSPHPGIINFFAAYRHMRQKRRSFRPLIRGLSISSCGDHGMIHADLVSVPSSGDYQFLRRWQALR